MTTATSLWPTDIKPRVVRPVTILKEQAAILREVTGGLLLGEVTMVTGAEDFTAHRFDIVAPRLDGYRHRILTVTQREQYYPVVMEAECFKATKVERVYMAQDLIDSITVKRTIGPRPWPDPEDWRPAVATQEEFEKKLSEVFRSPQVRGAIDSLLAKIDEQEQITTNPPAGGDGSAPS